MHGNIPDEILVKKLAIDGRIEIPDLLLGTSLVEQGIPAIDNMGVLHYHSWATFGEIYRGLTTTEEAVYLCDNEVAENTSSFLWLPSADLIGEYRQAFLYERPRVIFQDKEGFKAIGENRQVDIPRHSGWVLDRDKFGFPTAIGLKAAAEDRYKFFASYAKLPSKPGLYKIVRANRLHIRDVAGVPEFGGIVDMDATYSPDHKHKSIGRRTVRYPAELELTLEPCESEIPKKPVAKDMPVFEDEGLGHIQFEN